MRNFNEITVNEETFSIEYFLGGGGVAGNSLSLSVSLVKQTKTMYVFGVFTLSL